VTGFFLREVGRNPWAGGLAVLPPLLALGFEGRGEGVGLVGLYSSLLLVLPPLVLALALPLLASREEWAFLLGLPAHPARAFLEGVLGVFLGLLLPFLPGMLMAAGLLGLGREAALWFLLSGLGLLAFWVGLSALLSALSLEERRALGFGFALFGFLSVLYGPLVVALAVRLRDYPLEGLLTGALLLNPQEVHRVGLLSGLKAPVLTGPVGYLVAEQLGQVGPWLGLGYLVFSGLALALLAAWVFARRDR
jgi:ABC-2 type transport system permease protein